MEEIMISQLSGTVQELITNLIVRINNMLDEFDNSPGKEILSSEKILFILEDMSVLAEGIDCIYKEGDVINLEELTEKLTMLHESMETKDESLFKDIMEFELKPLLENWAEGIILN